MSRRWGFLTNHAHTLIQIARNPRSTVREIALASGITERAAHAIMADLRDAGLVSSRREGRQNVNSIDLASLVSHRPWGASDMEIPDSLIHATLRGLAGVASPSALPQAEAAPNEAPASRQSPGANGTRRWGFLTTHALVLIHVTQQPHSTVRDIALAVGVTERAAHSVLQDLREGRILDCERYGRRNSYTVNFEHLASFRREGTAPDLVPDRFVASLVSALLPLQPPDYHPDEDEPHPLT
ncbi:MAG: helix-turn-helix domain-containing protein [Dehalococcoidia bacterium]